MADARLVGAGRHDPHAPCRLCRAWGCPWDRFGRAPICAGCLEALASGEAPAARFRPRKVPCSVCGRPGAVRFVTWPACHPPCPWPLEMELCGRHLAALACRRLRRGAFKELRRQIEALGLRVGQVYLLHEAFYDRDGEALLPVESA